jgi:hypothetical protein
MKSPVPGSLLSPVEDSDWEKIAGTLVNHRSGNAGTGSRQETMAKRQ